MKAVASTWQTVGPFFSIGLKPRYASDIAGPNAAGERVAIAGRIFDGDGVPVPDAVLEIWQANTYGKYAHPEDTQQKPLDAEFLGYGRIPTDDNGAFAITTIKPGSVTGPEGLTQAPHLAVSLMMRGLLRRLSTRIYFPDEPLNERDEILQLVEPARRKTLLLIPEPGRAGHFRWDVHMQGEAETVIFEF